ncbi:16209_t:CDS:2, partial [Acaulospora morrowiae]
AAFRGAALSHQFKVKEIKIKDITPYPIEVSYVSEPKESEDGNKLYNIILFNEYSAVESRKLMSFKHTSDFNFTLKYGNLSENVEKNFGPKDIIISKITGLADAIKRFEDTSSEKPKVKVTLQLSESGFVTSKDAVLTIEQQTFTDKVKTFFGVNGNKSDDSIKEVPFQEETTSSVNASDPNELNNTQISETESQKQTKKIETITLNLEIENAGIKPLGTEEKENSIRRLRAMDDADRQRRAREEARNSLESF